METKSGLGEGPKSGSWMHLLGGILLALAVAAAYVAFYRSDYRYLRVRYRMLTQDIASGSLPERPPVRDSAVLDALRAVPRHRYVPKTERKLAYADQPIEVDSETTLTQPYLVAFMAEQLNLDGDDRVLCINVGSGYEVAVFAEIVSEVYAVAPLKRHLDRALPVLESAGYTNIHAIHAEGRQGWAEHAPYDAIFVRGAVSEIAEAWIDQLKPGGRMIVPLSAPEMYQSLVLVQKHADGTYSQEHVMEVRFLPLPEQD